jgi:hypothetical protein
MSAPISRLHLINILPSPGPAKTILSNFVLWAFQGGARCIERCTPGSEGAKLAWGTPSCNLVMEAVTLNIAAPPLHLQHRTS